MAKWEKQEPTAREEILERLEKLLATTRETEKGFRAMGDKDAEAKFRDRAETLEKAIQIIREKE